MTPYRESFPIDTGSMTNSTKTPLPARPLAPPVLLALLAVLAALTGCGDAPASPGAAGSAAGVDTVGGVEVAWSEGHGLWGPDTVRAEPVLVVGEIEGAPEYLFGMISGIVADSHGRIYVADLMASGVRVYSPEGLHLATIGRAGQGPGEFQDPLGLALGPDGALYVRDRVRVTRFDAEESGGVPERFTTSWAGPLYPNHTGMERLTGEGRYLYPRDHHPHDGESRYFYLVYAGEGEVVDTLHVPDFPDRPAAWASYRVNERSGRIVPGLNHPPFHPLPAWDATSRGTVVSGDGASYVLAETALSGATLRRIERRNLPAARIPEAERRDSLEALQARVEALPVPLSRVEGVHDDVRAGRVPENHPAFVAVHAGADGRVWVERWPPAGGAAYDVFAPDGGYLGVVALPVRFAREPSPYFAGDAMYGVVVDPETDVQRVVRLRAAVPEVGSYVAAHRPAPRR